ncbi:TIR domain-containing protein [Pseudomonas sp. A1230]|uniref:TIR domain-containing protein n=1 Tax=Pseudomonas sp. A1230 TaxID=3235106 RepID=UPI003784839C
MEGKPSVFIASSAEALTVAEAVNIKLSFETIVKQWDNAFDLSSVTITSLIQRAKETDFGVFVFHKDDETTIRGDKYSSVRDNVLFELGLFIGVLGIEKCFIVVPESKKGEFRLPTDLAGLTMTYYDDQLDDMVDAVTTSCARIKASIRKQLAVTLPQAPEESVVALLQQQLGATQSQLWSLGHETDRARSDAAKLLESIKNHFFSVAKPATPSEILAWEVGAKDAYLKEVKISRRDTYFVDKDVVIPPLYGAASISVLVASGVRVFGLDKWSHNTVYYMDGFRSDGAI